MKLTGPQRALLLDISERSRTVYESYPPIQKLLQLGFVVGGEGHYGSTHYTITDAGRAALQLKTGDGHE